MLSRLIMCIATVLAPWLLLITVVAAWCMIVNYLNAILLRQFLLPQGDLPRLHHACLRKHCNLSCVHWPQVQWESQ